LVFITRSYRNLLVNGGAHVPSKAIKEGRMHIVEDYSGLNI